jgi:hypothetical protein
VASTIKVDTIQSTTSNVFFQNSAGTEYARFDATGNFQLVNPTTFPAGTASLPSITATGDTNTGLYFPAADTIGFVEGGAEVMRITSAGNVGIGTSSPSGKLNVISGSVAQLIIGFNATSASYLDSDAIVFRNAATTEAGRFTSTGLFQFNSGYGSSATAYGCRAWVNFNGVGTVAIRGSGNVTSITDFALGQFTVNFTTAMPDANYAPVGMAGYKDATNNNEISWISFRRSSSSAFSTTACDITTGFTVSNAGSDVQYACVAFFR